MRKAPPAANPDAYVAALDGWRLACVTMLRRNVRAAAKLDEVVKWGHLVYFAGAGPVLLIRAEETRVLFGFWRGQRLLEIEPRLKPGGKYELATLDLREGDRIAATTVRRLAKEAVALNRKLGDATKVAKRGARSTAKKRGVVLPLVLAVVAAAAPSVARDCAAGCATGGDRAASVLLPRAGDLPPERRCAARLAGGRAVRAGGLRSVRGACA